VKTRFVKEQISVFVLFNRFAGSISLLVRKQYFVWSLPATHSISVEQQTFNSKKTIKTATAD
jgi:hypothetical protein